MKNKTLKILTYTLLLGLITSLGANVLVTRADTADPSAFWLTMASNAWRFFQPGVGVDASTGLPENSVGSSYFTDWDAGIYLQAVIDAEKLGLIERNGTWGFNDRVERFLRFLEKRPLMADGLPYLAYNSANGQNANGVEQVATDAGCLFVALKNLQTADPSLKSRIDRIVYDVTNYTRRQISVDILLGEMLSGTRAPNVYDYYVTCGFAAFWPQRFSAEADSILNLIVSAPKVNYGGVSLPSAKISCDPLLLSIFNLNPTDKRILALSEQVYLAQETRYNITGKFTAFSEGFCSIGFVWEWVVLPGGRMWIIQTGDCNDVDTDVSVTPIVYLKAATGLLAVYNTNYTQTMVNYLLQRIPASQNGYAAGVDEAGKPVSSCDFSNGLIVSAARYAVDKDVNVNFSYPYAPLAPSSISTETSAPIPQSDSNQTAALDAPTITPGTSEQPTPNAPHKANHGGFTWTLNEFLIEVLVVSFMVFICILAAVTNRLGKKHLASRSPQPA
ncbi:MAG: DUF3131 domain-containing protein [Candidatus Bathyarchaeota archaeon]|nr:DUF3131 domain-containing protein [Candidatus Bathyarchaeota archaeon]